MLLKIKYRGENSTDLGYLLHKNPNRTQVFEMPFGKAYVFYPEISKECTTACLLLEINPIDLVRGKLGSRSGGLFDYVNDRPYVSSSFLSTAISKVFNTALSGKCIKKPELVEQKLDLEAEIVMLPCHGKKELIERIFIPLGYQVNFLAYSLDDQFPEWKESHYVNLRIKGNIRLCDMLNHLYVLIPVFDNQKHYWVSSEEVEKLTSHGKGWLSTHPEKHLIATRYFNRKKSLINDALEMLTIEEESLEEGKNLDKIEKEDIKKNLNDLRLQAVTDVILANESKTILDIGCGEGKLITQLLHQKHITKITGVDVSIQCLERAKSRLHFDKLPEKLKEKIELLQGSLLYKDKRFSGYDAICIIEVIEHLEISRIPAFERVVFEFAAAPLIVITTPNAEYNINYERLQPDTLRHTDHRFEWTRKQFQDWANALCSRYGYCVEFFDIGEINKEYGAPTQMGVFKK